jgi:putative SOS response-associated peptidase YedK
MEPIHHRMPVILNERAYSSWLSPDLQNTVYLGGLLEPYEADEMEAYPVSLMVNNPRNDQLECVLPLK